MPELPVEVWHRIADVLIRRRCKVMLMFTVCKTTAGLASDPRLIDARIDALKTKDMDRVEVLVMWIEAASCSLRPSAKMLATVNAALLRIYADPSRRPANTKGARCLLKVASEYDMVSTVQLLLQLYPPLPGLLKTAYPWALEVAFVGRTSIGTARLLIEAGASLGDGMAGDLLLMAAQRGNLDLVRLVLDAVRAAPFEDRVLQRSDNKLFAEDSDYEDDFDEAVSLLPNGAAIKAAGLDTLVIRTSRIPSIDDFDHAVRAAVGSCVRDELRCAKAEFWPNSAPDSRETLT